MHGKTPGRREFLRRSVHLMLLGAGWSCASQGGGKKPSRQADGKETPMKLSLSARVAESFSNKEETSLNLAELIELARNHGYQALCMRASQAGIHSPPEKVSRMSRRIAEAGLKVSMVTGDFAVPRNDELGPAGLRNIAPFLDLAESFGADLIRVCMKKDEDIPWAQKASDQAAERGIRLAHQSHCASLFETVEGSLQVLEKVDRPNFGIIYEPANWMIAGEDYGRETIKRLGPRLFNVYVQNHRLNPRGEGVVRTWNRGPVRLDHIGLWESGGDRFRRGLRGPAGGRIPGLCHRAPGLCGHHVGGGSRPPQRQVPQALDGVKRGCREESRRWSSISSAAGASAAKVAESFEAGMAKS